MIKPISFLFAAALLTTHVDVAAQAKKSIAIEKIAGVKPRNVIFILSDDHRYDFMGFTGKVPGLQTPNLDRLAKEGAHLQNAFVTTALCSPSRASILTGQYAHTHTVVDNKAPAPDNLLFFPQYLQKAGYQTALVGKWHMGGETDDPRPGFNHWVSFKGQGVYYNPLLNIDGKQVQYKDSTYITDLLTELSIDWLKKRDKKKPFFLYLSHKAVHERNYPAKRHVGVYNDLTFNYPPSLYTTATPESKKFTRGKPMEWSYDVNTKDIPDWVRAQRYSWHGVDYMYHDQISLDDFYQQYLETLLGVDNSIGRVLDYLKATGLDKETLVIYMGDNGFALGEHGLIDKRHAYEESMRVPMLARCPGVIKPETKVEQMVLNIDIAPTILEIAGIRMPSQMQGKSFLPLVKGENPKWRDRVFYEYYWENNFPQTPTQYAIRTDQYKFIRTIGTWDINQVFDIKKDPYEMNNLIRKPELQDTIKQLNNELWDWLEKTGGMQIPLKRINIRKTDNRHDDTW